jgi:hypothetical protein
MSRKIREIASRVYDNIEIAMWAMLFAFVIYVITFVLPKLPEIQAQRTRVRVEEIGAENASLCEKLSIKRGIEKYNQCLLDVGEFRSKVEKRANDEISW